MTMPAPSTPATSSPRRVRLVVRGRVQGVGFRPFVYRLAHRHHLGGWIANTAQGATIEIEGDASELDAFRAGLLSQAPPTVTIEQCSWQTIPVQDERTFQIHPSLSSGSRLSVIAPDLATCAECLQELFDPRARRYRYPFTTCAGCGPRYSIIQELPYDRVNTTMKPFPMCDDCAHEYDTMADRRFHAETIACPTCGPHVWLCDSQGTILAECEEALARACTVIREGGIVAVKGLGGFQLWVDARIESAVRRLRERKHRPRKPLAVLFPSLEVLRACCQPNDQETHILTSPKAPIVLMRKVEDASLAPSVAPDNPELGAMLPYTPLHHLLMDELGFPVVATSGNRSDEPIAIDNEEARVRLCGIADVFLMHNRPIARPVDDSVARVENGHVRLFRRARGYVPSPLLPSDSSLRPHASVLAVGGHLKNTIAVSTPDHLVVSQHIGDLSTIEAYAQFRRTIEDQLNLFHVRPRAIACDLHPDYSSTAFAHHLGAEEQLPVISVQHHHAHIVAGMTEYGLDGPVLGVAWDGAGYGLDSAIWGGECLLCEYATFRRIAHLRPFPLPGGEIAAREPRRIAFALLHEIFGHEASRLSLPPLSVLDRDRVQALTTMLTHRIQCPMTTSMGRLFDGVSSLLGFCQQSTFEGEAAMALEFGAAPQSGSTAANERETPLPSDASLNARTPLEALFPLSRDPSSMDETETWQIDWRPLITFLVKKVLQGQDARMLARLFHRACANVIVRVARHVGLSQIVLGGGVFQNRLLCRFIDQECRPAGLTVYVPRRFPCNDGGLALGQALVADHMLQKETKPPETHFG